MGGRLTSATALERGALGCEMAVRLDVPDLAQTGLL